MVIASHRFIAPVLAVMLAVIAFALCPPSLAAGKPPVRAITTFIELDPQQYEQQLTDIVQRLRQARAVFQKAGFEVQTLRITTQPFPHYVRGLSREQALKLLFAIEELGRKQAVAINIGPAVMDDRPDAAMLELLEAAHSELKQLDATMIVARENGVHWNSVRAAARHV